MALVAKAHGRVAGRGMEARRKEAAYSPAVRQLIPPARPPGAISITQPLPDAKRRPARDTSASTLAADVFMNHAD